MPDILRTALVGGGELRLRIEMCHNGDMVLTVHELQDRLTSCQTETLTAAALSASEDPDGLVARTLKTLVDKGHIRYEARQAAGER